MKISLEWLSEYLPGPLDAGALAEALTHGGLPVELIEQHGDDTVIDVEVTSNRSDCLSHIGVARELAALLNREFRDINPRVTETATPASAATSVQIHAKDLCPLYTARIIRNVKIGPSPAWMQRRLEAVGLRPINNVVDVTNYVLFETGQPLHAFDFDRLAEQRIVVRNARQGEKIISIDGHARALDPYMLVIADARNPVALAGVMGGRDSEVSANTTNILLESARFDPLIVRRTARALAMKSDSSYRFERGIDPTLPLKGSLRAAQLILDTAGGELLSGYVEAGRADISPRQISLRLPRLRQVLGIDIPPQQVMEALARLRLAPSQQGDRIDVTVPTDRLDLNLEIDLVEEVARLIGYDKIPMRDQIEIRVTPPEPSLRTIDQIREVLVAAGYYEAITFTFVSDALAGDFVPADASSLARADSTVRKADAQLRPSILPGLLEAVRRNESVGNAGAKLFEIGSTFWHNPAGALQERRRIGLVGSSDYREVRGVVEAILQRLSARKSITITPDSRAGFSDAGRIEWDGQTIGHVGLIDKTPASHVDLREIPAAAELDLAPLLAAAQHVPQLQPLPRFPSVRRDLSLVVDESVQFAQIERLVRDAQPQYLEEIEFVTTYRGKQVEKGRKSVTISLIFRSPTATLTSEAVEASVQQIITAATSQLRAILRA